LPIEALYMKKTLKFLADLKANSNQAWFLDNIGDYEQIRSEIEDLTYVILTELSISDTKLNPEIDVTRFVSTLVIVRPKKPVAYFDFFDVEISPVSNDGNEPAYVLHIEPNEKSYISIKYEPDVFGLQVMRNYISKNAVTFDNLVQDCFSSGYVLEESSMLPSLPKGYPIGTPGESFIRLRKYELRSPIDILKKRDELTKDILVTFNAALPFIQFLRNGLGL
jgi:uncharacterized protein (DUF2461 family)